MVIEINSIQVWAGEGDAFADAFASAAELLRRVKGCRTVALLRCIERPDQFQVQIEWEQLSDHTEHYPTTSEAAEVRALLLPFFESASPGHFVPA